MENGEINQERRLHGPWHYDQVWEKWKANSEEAKHLHREAYGELKKTEKTVNTNRRGENTAGFELLALRRDLTDQAARFYEQRQNWAYKFRMINEARPFLIGPATLDSLFEEEPEKFEYMEEGHLPFDNMFFDFVRPIKYPLPFQDKEVTLIGASLHKPKIAQLREQIAATIGAERIRSEGYVANLYSYTEENEIGNPINATFFIGALPTNDGGLSRPLLHITSRVKGGDEDSDVLCEIFPAEDMMRYRKGADKWDHFDKLYSEDPSQMSGFTSFRKYSALGLLAYLPNFCVNMVNYINSHNVNVTQRARGKYVPYSDAEIPFLPPNKRPFHLITVQDETAEELQNKAARSWSLQWRVYVRGHNRHFRDDQGRIALVSWTSPHVRGPPDAPWREQRYEVLAKKLEEEKAMYEGLGL